MFFSVKLGTDGNVARTGYLPQDLKMGLAIRIFLSNLKWMRFLHTSGPMVNQLGEILVGFTQGIWERMENVASSGGSSQDKPAEGVFKLRSQIYVCNNSK